MGKGRPIPLLIYGDSVQWTVDAIIVTQNYWYFRQFTFDHTPDVHNDPFGFTYHRVHLELENEICLGKVKENIQDSLCVLGLPFWDYGMVLADVLTDTINFRYAILRTNWQYLDQDRSWSKHE